MKFEIAIKRQSSGMKEFLKHSRETVEELKKHEFMLEICNFMKKIVQQRIETWGEYFINVTFLPNADRTIKNKGFDQRYYETGELQRSVKVEHLTKEDWFVGVVGEKASIAKILEHGAFIPRGDFGVLIPAGRLFTDIAIDIRVKEAIAEMIKKRMPLFNKYV